MAYSSDGPAIFEDTLGVNLTVFRSRLAKRFSTMFVVCSLLPILVLAILSYYGVTKQLADQAFSRLRQSAKSHGLSIYEDLLLANNQLDTIHALLTHQEAGDFSALPPAVVRKNRELFSGIAVLGADKLLLGWGNEVSALGWKRIQSMDLKGDTSTVIAIDSGAKWPDIVIVRAAAIPGVPKAYIAGVIKSSYLWESDQGSFLPPASEFSVHDADGRCLYRSYGHLSGAEPPNTRYHAGTSAEREHIVVGGKHYYASSWSMFLKPKFGIPAWLVTVMEPRDFVLEPMRYFNKIFPMILLLSLVIVVFLSYRAIAKSLVPIDSLIEGAHSVAERRFDHRVVVESGDEFQDLADAFNRMTDELDAQFKVLAARSDLDRAILSVLDIETIIAASLRQSNQLFPFRKTAISILETDKPLQGRSYTYDQTDHGNVARAVPFCLTDEEHSTLQGRAQWLHLDPGSVPPSYLAVLPESRSEHYVVLPIRIRDTLFGLVSFGTDEKISDLFCLQQIRAFCDHLAVAFSNSNLLKQLKDLNMGTLQALARTVDAKSPWTAGHSLRVTEMAIHIGAAMGLTAEQMDGLERGSLLHDIGKIGIPSIVLDKEGKLTPEEYNIVKSHPSKGARILTPIRAYAGIIPIVEQHHERFDGKGYPYGLKGYEIHIGARIIAVADSFDAMVSDRPYRRALGRQRAIEIIHEEAGLQFDPEVAGVFANVVEQTDAPIHSGSMAEGFLLSSDEIDIGHYVPETVRQLPEKREIKP